MTSTQVLVGIPCELLLHTLRAAVLHLNGEKATMAVGQLAAILKLLENADVPPDQLPECIAACKFVQEGVRSMREKYNGLALAVNLTLASLETKLARV
ncbi:MAG: hypothetical protein A3A44_02885 [Candidatus Sungbacteria bacterium RIFCSPLOWO2_01_FULL_60_25]|uniref:Uncharacterized protein n=1 Tax=Candidatus Sungbacteria bacterium RIFCSPLOWO2_01_FULL_60_25 TaxID=1802281 RepID=A0A1G2LA97_9BACT|nr:MAG: hypothetical protein A3A44_02885 [Candidatus Sungbacteria bacterium RIFCSPLOWO2_01_FULL_60_25]